MTISPELDHPAELADLVEYQSGSIVSHALLKSASARVSLFAFDASEALSEHMVPFDAFAYIIDGRATITIAGRPHVVASGQMIRLPASVPHAVHADERFKMLLVMIRAATPEPDGY